MARVLVLGLAVLAGACTDRSPAEGTTGASTGSSSSSSSAPTTGEPPTPTTGTSEGTGTTTSTTDDPVCEDYTIGIHIPQIVPQVMLVLDRSPAMLDPWDHDLDPQTPDEPRWASVRRAIIAQVPGEAPVELGLASYPTADAGDVDGPAACLVTPGLLLAPGEVSAAELPGLLPPEQSPPGSFVGGVPLRAALTAAASLLQPDSDRPLVILVIGTGAANCRSDPPDPASLLETLDDGVFAAANVIHADGVGVGVIGVGAATQPNPVAVDGRPDDVAPFEFLQELAAQSGATLDNAASEAELAQILASFFAEGSGTSCVVELDPAPTSMQKISEVRVAGQPFEGPVDCQTGDGWWLPMPTQIELCGAACQLFKDTADLEIDVVCAPE